MRLSDNVLIVILMIDLGAIVCVLMGTFLLILEEGLYLTKDRKVAGHARLQAKYAAEGRVYREQERARAAEVSK
jgi:hypothetical protein